MMAKYRRCIYGVCKNSGTSIRKVIFYRFPNPKKQLYKCQMWIQACGLDVSNLSNFDYKKTPRYVCEDHFIGGNGPTMEHPNPSSFPYKIEMVRGCRQAIPRDISTVLPALVNDTLNVASTSGETWLETVTETTDEWKPNPGALEHEEILPDVSSNNCNSVLVTTIKKEVNVPSSTSIQTIKQEVDSDDSQDTSFSLATLRKYVEYPINWTIRYGYNLAKFSLEQNDHLILTFYVHENMATSLTVLGKILTDHPLLQDISPVILSPGDVLSSLKKINEWCICKGNLKEQFKILRNKIGNGTYCDVTKAYHSKNCEWLTRKFRSHGRYFQRCTSCIKYRASLRTKVCKKSKCKNKGPSKMKRIDLIHNYKKGQKRQRLLSRRIESLKFKCKRLSQEKGHGVISEDDSQCLKISFSDPSLIDVAK